MAEKVLIISSSPRRGGNSDRLCDEFMKGAQASGKSAEKIFLKDYKINYCVGCGACSERNLPCPQKDDAAMLVQKMIDADIIVMATPVYFYSISAQMKTLIDRTCARYTEMIGKKFYFIMTCAESDPACMDRTLEDFRGFLDCLENAQEVGALRVAGVWKKGEIENTKYLSEAYEAGEKI